jgi:sialidase-1
MRQAALILTIYLAACCTSVRNTHSAEPNRRNPTPLAEETRQKCLQVLRAAVVSDEFWPAMHAAEALTLAGEQAHVVQVLTPKLKTEADPQRRCGLNRELLRTGDRLRLPEMWAILADEQSTGRIHAAESLYKLGEVGDGRLLRAALAQNGDLRLQLMAAAGLARAGSPTAVERLRAKLTHEDREIRKIAAWALGLVGDSSDIPTLHKILAAETDPLAQAYYVNALACLGDDAGRAQLGRNLSHADAAVRTYSADFSGYARAVEFTPRLSEMLDDENLDTRIRAAQSLIALSLPPSALGLPIASTAEPIVSDPYPATKEHPRYSEGSVIALRDNSLLYATTEFVGGGADHAGASIIGRISRDGGRTWEAPRTLQANIGKQNVMSVTLRRLPREGQSGDARPLGMFILVKNGPNDLDLMLRVSEDDGQSFAEPILISPEAGYHVMNNDRVTILSTGRIICPVATTDEVFRKGGGHFVSLCYFSDDGGKTWRRGAGKVDQPQRGAMEPEVVELADGRLLMIVRTQLGVIATSISSDGGDHWSQPSKLPVEAPEAPATIRTIPATGDLLLIWNSDYKPGAGHGGPRTPLSAAFSSDEGQTWRNVKTLEADPKLGYAYTSVLFHKDRALLSYYVQDPASGRISSRFRSLPVRWFYEIP